MITSEKIISLGVYTEFAYDKTWCFKQQFPGLDCIIVSHADKEKAASNFFIEYLKGIHYSIRYLIAERSREELNQFVDKMKAKGDENINKTIEIALRMFKPAT